MLERLVDQGMDWKAIKPVLWLNDNVLAEVCFPILPFCFSS
jgi:hypothetical protein